MRRRWPLIGLAVVVLGVLAVVGVFVLRGSNEPPPPSLSEAPAGAAPTTGTTGFRIAGGGSFVGYRVRERFASIGVVDAVGRTSRVSGTLTVEGDRLVAADLRADLRALRSDEEGRDAALGTRGIETDRFPTARFLLTRPVGLREGGATAAGALTLHGRTRPVEARVRGRVGAEALEVVGSAPIPFAAFAIEPPSVAGVVTVSDRGTLEFRLRARRADD